MMETIHFSETSLNFWQNTRIPNRQLSVTTDEVLKVNLFCSYVRQDFLVRKTLPLRFILTAKDMGKFTPCNPPRRGGEVELWLHSFLMSALGKINRFTKRTLYQRRKSQWIYPPLRPADLQAPEIEI